MRGDLIPGTRASYRKPMEIQLRSRRLQAHHGPVGIEHFSGDVVGFVISSKSNAFKAVYVTGCTVWFEGVADVQRRFRPALVLLFAGAAQTRGKFNLTMNANDAIEAANAFSDALIIPLLMTVGHISRKAAAISKKHSMRSGTASACAGLGLASCAFRAIGSLPPELLAAVSEATASQAAVCAIFVAPGLG